MGPRGWGHTGECSALNDLKLSGASVCKAEGRLTELCSSFDKMVFMCEAGGKETSSVFPVWGESRVDPVGHGGMGPRPDLCGKEPLGQSPSTSGRGTGTLSHPTPEGVRTKSGGWGTEGREAENHVLWKGEQVEPEQNSSLGVKKLRPYINNTAADH